MTNLKNADCASHISLKAPKVDEAWAGKITRLVVIDAEEEVQGERGDHGGKELKAEQTKKKWNIKSSAKELGQRSHTKCYLRFSMSASGSRKRLPPLERTELHLFRKKENILMKECQMFLPMWTEPITEEYPVLWTSYFLVYLSWLLKHSNKMTASCNPAV